MRLEFCLPQKSKIILIHDPYYYYFLKRSYFYLWKLVEFFLVFRFHDVLLYGLIFICHVACYMSFQSGNSHIFQSVLNMFIDVPSFPFSLFLLSGTLIIWTLVHLDEPSYSYSTATSLPGFSVCFLFFALLIFLQHHLPGVEFSIGVVYVLIYKGWFLFCLFVCIMNFFIWHHVLVLWTQCFILFLWD